MKRHITSTIFLWAIAISLLLLGQPAVVSAQVVEAIPVYRFFAPNSGHYYSTSPTPPGGYHVEGISFYVSPVELPYTVPLYGLAAQWDTLYTISISEKDGCLQNGYVLHGVIGYVLPADRELPGTSPLHRWRGIVKSGWPAVSHLDHLFAATKPNVPGYTYEGEAARIWTEPVKLPQQLVELTVPAAGSTIQINSNPVIRWNIWSKGGAIRLSYSTNNGASWRPIATVPNNGVLNQMNDQSFNGWNVPPEAAGKIMIKADWIRSGLFAFAQGLPWATDMMGPISVPAKLNIGGPIRRRNP